MMTNEDLERVRGWFAGRLPDEWKVEAPEVTVDREEITVILTIADVRSRPRAVRAPSATRPGRVGPARSARTPAASGCPSPTRPSTRFDRKVSWGVRLAGIPDQTALFTHVAAPVMTRLRQPQRLVLDTLVDAGVARSRADALAWCVRLVGQHEEDWLAELRKAMESVADVRAKGPAA